MPCGPATVPPCGLAIGWDRSPPFIRNQPSSVHSTGRSEEHTSELQSLMRISYAVFCLKKKKKEKQNRRNYTKASNHKRRINHNTNITTRILKASQIR